MSLPDTLGTVMNIANVYDDGPKAYEEAEALFIRAPTGYEEQFGIDHTLTIGCAMNLKINLERSEQLTKLALLSYKCPQKKLPTTVDDWGDWNDAKKYPDFIASRKAVKEGIL